MSFWIMLQILADVFLIAGLVFAWAKLTRPAKDDPRLSRGLQILQSKISILEDLSDRTETQVQQLNSLMEQKAREVQNQLLSADKHIQQIEVSMQKSMEVAQIFQDRIPHEEIVERQNTLKYIKAAKLAHQGVSVEEIAKQVDLSFGEIEFIAKVNRDQLQFSEAALPAWAKAEPSVSNNHNGVQGSIPSPEKSLSSLGEKFRQALSSPAPSLEFFEPSQVQSQAPTQVQTQFQTQVTSQSPLQSPLQSQAPAKPKSAGPEIRKVVFPRIDATRNLG